MRPVKALVCHLLMVGKLFIEEDPGLLVGIKGPSRH